MDKKVLEQVNSRTPFACERRLALHDHECEGRITREHALVFAGRKVDEAWAIVLLCAKSHNVDLFQDTGILNKEINEWLALSRMTPKIERYYSKARWGQKRDYLNSIYGVKNVGITGLQ